MPEFKDMLVFLRKKNNMSQSELAKKVGVAPTTIASYEQGKRHPSFEIEEAIADIFNVNLDTLRGKETDTSPYIHEIMQAAFCMDDNTREELFRYAKYLLSTRKA